MKVCEMEMLGSLIKSIYKAGGNIPMSDLASMTVSELIEALAPNGVRFVCVKDTSC